MMRGGEPRLGAQFDGGIIKGEVRDVLVAPQGRVGGLIAAAYRRHLTGRPRTAADLNQNRLSGDDALELIDVDPHLQFQLGGVGHLDDRLVLLEQLAHLAAHRLDHAVVGRADHVGVDTVAQIIGADLLLGELQLVDGALGARQVGGRHRLMAQPCDFQIHLREAQILFQIGALQARQDLIRLHFIAHRDV